MENKLSQYTSNNLDLLYDRDYYFWLNDTVKLLQEGQLDRLDVANLIVEIEDMGRSEKRAIKGNLVILLMHLLKYRYQIDKRSNSWRYTITEHRLCLQDSLQTSPSLKNYLLEVVDTAYRDARRLAADETGLAIDFFPENIPFLGEEILNIDYLPV